jgi:hypothetical protein
MPHDLILPKRQGVEAPRAPAVCLSWRPHQAGTLRGFCDIELPSGLVLCDISVHESAGQRWANPAGIPALDADRRQRLGPNGKPDYRPSARFAHSGARERFRAAVLAALEEAGIQCFDGPENEP